MHFKKLIDLDGTIEDCAAEAIKTSSLWYKSDLNLRKCHSFKSVRLCQPGSYSTNKPLFYVTFVVSQEKTDNWVECRPSELYVMHDAPGEIA